MGSLFQIIANLVLTWIELLTLLLVCGLHVDRSFGLVDFVETFATSVVARVVYAPISILFQVEHI